MRYRLYIYKSNAATGSASALDIVNAAVSDSYESAWREYEVKATDYMEHFDAEGIKNRIDTELGDKCRIKICTYAQKEYLYISTSFDRITEVLPRVHLIAMENRLALYDAETGRTFFKSLFDDAFITLRIRERELRDCIERELKPLWRIRKIHACENGAYKSSSYSVTLKKDRDKPFSRRASDLFDCLKKNLKADEELVCKDRSFIVSGEYYSVTFVLEGYKGHANWIGFFENGLARQELICRMSVEEASKWMECCYDTEKNDIRKRMNFTEMKEKFPNPADRFVNSVRITKWQRKQVFDIRYSDIGYYGSEVIFHVLPDIEYENADTISVLKIEESSASFILPIIHDVYPYIGESCFWDEDHLPTNIWKEIIGKMKEIKEMILNDTFNPALEKYIDVFNLFVFDKNDDPRIYKRNKEYDPKAFVYDHRFEIAYLYDIFIQWSETQLHYQGEDCMFNVQGP